MQQPQESASDILYQEIGAISKFNGLRLMYLINLVYILANVMPMGKLLFSGKININYHLLHDVSYHYICKHPLRV